MTTRTGAATVGRQGDRVFAVNLIDSQTRSASCPAGEFSSSPFLLDPWTGPAVGVSRRAVPCPSPVPGCKVPLAEPPDKSSSN